MKKDVVHISKGKLWHVEGNIIFIVFDKGSEVDIDDVKETIKISIKIVEGNSYVFCVDIRDSNSLSKEARDFARTESPDFPSALALIIGSPLSRFWGNLFIRFVKPNFPTKLFCEKEEAVEWLRQFAG